MKTLNKIGHLVPKHKEIPDNMVYGMHCPNCTYVNTAGNMDLIGKVIDCSKASKNMGELMIVVAPLNDKYCLTVGHALHIFSIAPIKIIRQMLEAGLEYESPSFQ